MIKINTDKAPAAIGPYSQGFITCLIHLSTFVEVVLYFLDIIL